MGFAVSFDLPFHRDDLWKELLAPQPLGVHDTVRVNTAKPPSEQQSSAPRDPSRNSIPEPGDQRTVEHEGRTTISRLVCVNNDLLSAFQIWEVTEQHGTRFSLVGHGSLKPRTSVYLADVLANGSRGEQGGGGPPIGTAITLGFDYDHLEDPKAGWWSSQWWARAHSAAALEVEFRSCFDGVADYWRRGMAARGYEIIAAEAVQHVLGEQEEVADEFVAPAPASKAKEPIKIEPSRVAVPPAHAASLAAPAPTAPPPDAAAQQLDA